MPRLWMVAASERCLSTMFALEDLAPPKFEWVNKGDFFAVRRQIDRDYDTHGIGEREMLTFRAMPSAVLRIADPGFTFDFFDNGLQCVSERLREALGLPGGVVSYRDADLRQSAAPVRAKRYQAMQPLLFADPIDKARTPGVVLDLTMPGGPVRQEWSVGAVEGRFEPIHWRDDFVPPAPLFRVPGTPWTLATDELAARVQASGAEGIVFQDVAGEQAPGKAILRQP